MEFKKAERKQAKIRLALASPAGGGKTYSALLIAKGIGGKIAMIDTEHGSGSLYAGVPGIPDYDVLELSPPFSPKRYIEAIKLAEKDYAILIIDSLSHAWAAEGGVLDMQEAARLASKSGNSWTAWREVTPQHNELVEAMLQSPCHIIATMRSRQSYAQEEQEGADGKKKAVIKKLGLAPVQREGMDYEFTLVLDLSQEHYATSSKDRTMLFDGQHFKPSEETGAKILEWLNKAKMQSPVSLTASPPVSLTASPPVSLTASPPSSPPVSPPANPPVSLANSVQPIFPQTISPERVDELSRLLTAKGFLPGKVRQDFFRKNKIPTLSALTVERADKMIAYLKTFPDKNYGKDDSPVEGLFESNEED